MFESASGGPLSFWSSYTLGMLLRLPVSATAAAHAHASHLRDYARTYRRKVVVLDHQLELWFLGAPRADLVPLIFGERYCAILYRGALVDPGSVLMRRSLERHLEGATAGSVTAVTATHAHEEHVGNLEWAANRTAAPLYLPGVLARHLRSPRRLPIARAFAFGRPHALTCQVSDTAAGIPIDNGCLEVIPAPGHSAEHVALFDPQQRVLLVGDTFIGAYFSAANAETDGNAWLGTLRRLLDLDFDLMVEGHGRVHTLRRDVPAIPGVVIREDPRLIMAAKLRFLTRLARRARAARDRGLSLNRAVAEAFPWQQRPSWDRLFADELARVTSCGEFSRHKLVKSFLDPATAGPR
jgi:glyoxylase-like metal-dependent hydrolase (beta-lactamase superfamily II)